MKKFQDNLIRGPIYKTRPQNIIVRESTIPFAGLGAFAARNFRKGDFIDYYHGNKYLTKKQWENLEDSTYVYDLTSVVKNPKKVVMDEIYTDARRINCAPKVLEGKKLNLINCDYFLHPEEPHIQVHAIRDIKCGEEFFAHYGNQYDYSFLKNPKIVEFFKLFSKYKFPEFLEVRASLIPGVKLGLFSTKIIPEGKLIGQYGGVTYTEEEAKKIKDDNYLCYYPGVILNNPFSMEYSYINHCPEKGFKTKPNCKIELSKKYPYFKIFSKRS